MTNDNKEGLNIIDFERDLRELARLIRVGLADTHPHAFNPVQGPRALRHEISKLLFRLRTLKNFETDPLFYVNVLQFKALRAEFEYAFGAPDGEAANHLRDFLQLPPTTSPRSSSLLLRLGAWRKGKTVLERPDPRDDFDQQTRFRRQQVWALMAYAFFCKFEHEGDAAAARDLLDTIHEVIKLELLHGKTYQANGTIAQLHAFRAQCHRALRSFAKSQADFMESQRYAERRLRQKVEGNAQTVEKREAYSFSVIFTARILGGVGRIAILQGDLRRAEVLFRSARTLLRPTGQTVLKNVVASHLAIVERRLCSPVSQPKAWPERLGRLTQLYNRFIGAAEGESAGGEKPKRGQAVNKADEDEAPLFTDQDGARRVAQELALAYLDQAEVTHTDERGPILVKAEVWIKNLESLAALRAAPEESIERFRARLLSIRWQTLKRIPDFDSADECQEKILTKRFSHWNDDVTGLDAVDVRLSRCILDAAKCATGRLVAGHRAPVDVLAKAFAELARGAQSKKDRHLEAEARLRWALAEQAIARRKEEASAQRAAWLGLRDGLESAFLHDLDRVLIEKGCEAYIAVGTVGYQDRKAEAEYEALANAMTRVNNNRERAAELLGMSRGQFRAAASRVEKERGRFPPRRRSKNSKAD